MHKSRGQIACNQRTDGGLRGWRWELGASSTSILSQILGFLPFQHHQQEDVGRAASESHLPLPSVHPLDLRTAGGRLSLHLCTSVPCPVHQVRTLSIRISIWGTRAYKSVFGSVTFSSCPPPGPRNSSRKQGLPLFSMHRAKLPRENGLELDIVWQLKSHHGKILTQETGLLGGVRTDLETSSGRAGNGCLIHISWIGTL